MKDYIPGKDSELVQWGNNFADKVAIYATKFGIDADTVAALAAALAAFKLWVAVTDGPERNKVNVSTKNAARKEFVNQIRALANFQLKNPVITDSQRLEMGLRVHDAKPTPILPPTEVPAMEIELLGPRRLSFVFHSPDSESKAKPYGVIGAVIVYGVLDIPTTSQEALPHSVLATRTPHTLEFTADDRGKTVYYAICWQNERGQRGPFSEVGSTIVP
ncbi:MAG: hypothetical protein LBS80_01655 [Tannerella sp.]|jgi:hypothetical protein|nr:hypothetical protein [Tannerella sp.]